jgi:hypothetical protein
LRKVNYERTPEPIRIEQKTGYVQEECGSCTEGLCFPGAEDWPTQFDEWFESEGEGDHKIAGLEDDTTCAVENYDEDINDICVDIYNETNAVSTGFFVMRNAVGNIFSFLYLCFVDVQCRHLERACSEASSFLWHLSLLTHLR